MTVSLFDHKILAKGDMSRVIKTEKNRVLLEAAKSFDPNTDNFYLFGPVGAGKTFIASCIASKYHGRIVRSANIVRVVRRTFDYDELNEEMGINLFCGHKISTYSFYENIGNCFVMDDLGIEKLTEYAESVLCEILDRRIAEKINGLLVTSNLSLDHLAEKIGSERISSRLAQLCKVFSLEGEKDWRMEKEAIDG